MGTQDIGKKLKQLRIQRNLTQEEMADRCELSKGFISQVERNLASPSIATLTDMLEALGTTLEEFFSGPSQEQFIFTENDMFEKVDEDLGVRVVWLVPVAQKNRMEPILITLSPGGRTEEIEPHEGEEFGYVLQGSPQLVLGGQTHRLKPGASFSIHPGQSHYLLNKTKTQARVLWISTPPSF